MQIHTLKLLAADIPAQRDFIAHPLELQVGFAHGHDMVKAFPTNTPHQSFADYDGHPAMDTAQPCSRHQEIIGA